MPIPRHPGFSLAAAALCVATILPLPASDEKTAPPPSASTKSAPAGSTTSSSSTTPTTRSSTASSSRPKSSTSTSPSAAAPQGSSTRNSAPASATNPDTRSSTDSARETPSPPSSPVINPLLPADITSQSHKPPKGTLGATYSRISHPVPSDKHPRLGMLAVRDNHRHPNVTVQHMSGLRLKSGVWLFESSRPLDPGVDQTVRVEAREQMVDVAPYATRFVRLIPGRIVYLDFSDPAED